MNKQKIIFEFLIAKYEKRISKYFTITRERNHDEPSSKIAFEMSVIFKQAEEILSYDPLNPYGYEAFEKECPRIRSKYFG